MRRIWNRKNAHSYPGSGVGAVLGFDVSIPTECFGGRWSILTLFLSLPPLPQRFLRLFWQRRWRWRYPPARLSARMYWVDPFVTDSENAVLIEPTRYLLWAPFLADQGFDQSPSGFTNLILRFMASIQCKLMGLFWSISFQSAILTKLFADCGFVKIDQTRNFGLIVSCL